MNTVWRGLVESLRIFKKEKQKTTIWTTRLAKNIGGVFGSAKKQKTLIWIKRKAPTSSGQRCINDTSKEQRSRQRSDLPKVMAELPALPVSRSSRWGFSARGYTVIEVMIVLAVTGILFSAAVLLFHGQQAKTSLSQNLYDLASKLQSYANEVNSGVYSGGQNYSCSISNGKASLAASGSNTQGSNYNCLFLGRVVQLIPDSNIIYVYTVIGNRNVYNGANDTGRTASQLEDTNPQIATSGGSMVLVDTYSLPGDITISSTKTTSASDGSALDGYGDLVGLYSDLSDSGGSSSDLETIAFPFPNGGGQNTPYSSSMANCVALNAGCASTTSGYGGNGYQRIASWGICVQNGSAQAEVKIKTSSSGISTEVDTQSCS